jgi:hypothetical protein
VGFFVQIARTYRIGYVHVFESKTRSPALQNTNPTHDPVIYLLFQTRFMDRIVAATPADLPGELPTNSMVVYSGGG